MSSLANGKTEFSISNRSWLVSHGFLIVPEKDTEL
jgi:hypothetical protein